MRKFFLLAILVVVLAGFNLAILHKERQLAGGIEILLRLAPVDPRALLMGDYMTLEYRINASVRKALAEQYGNGGRRHDARNRWPASGMAVVRIAGPGEHTPKGEALFVRMDNGAMLAPDEARLAFRIQGGNVVTASTAFYFQEGHGKAFESAVYGRLRLDAEGKSLLVALCDREGNDIRQQKDTAL